MTDREYLVKLIQDAVQGCSAYWAGLIADHLLAHGVTVREPGEWKTDKEDIEWGNSLKRKYCSRCGKRPYFDKEKHEFVLSNFCPHCGAPMEDKSNENHYPQRLDHGEP